MHNVKDLLHFRPFQNSGKDKVCIPKNLKDQEKMASQPLSSPIDTPMSAPMTTMAPGDKQLTVVELFQSQGCSSCSTANDNVISLTGDSDKLVLTYEVTYWDYLGWPDTFGSKEWDQRQRDYSSAFKNRSVYTPQVIVNGVANGVGSRQSELKSIIQDGSSSPNASAANVSVVDGKVTVSGPTGIRAIVQLVRYDPRNHDVAIQRGENRGRNLPHKNVVRDLIVLGWWEGGELAFPLPEMESSGLQAAIIVQKGRGGPIIGAAKV